MECRILEIVLVSAKDLKDVNLFSKMDVYAIAEIDGETDKQKQKTKVDKDCGPNPKWNHAMKFTIDKSAAMENRLTLKIKIKSDVIGKDKEIGHVHIPITELFDDGKEDEVVSYNVTTPSGKIKGTLNFSYHFGEKFTVAAAAPPPPPPPVVVVDREVVPPIGAAYPDSSSGYPQYPPQAGYPAPPGQYAYTPPPQQGYGYGYGPPQQGYGGYPQPQPGYGGYNNPGYGYPPQPQPGYGGYPAQPGYDGYPPQQQKKSGLSGGAGIALGVGAGLVGGLLIEDMISDSYDAGFEDGADDF